MVPLRLTENETEALPVVRPAQPAVGRLRLSGSLQRINSRRRQRDCARYLALRRLDPPARGVLVLAELLLAFPFGCGCSLLAILRPAPLLCYGYALPGRHAQRAPRLLLSFHDSRTLPRSSTQQTLD